VLLSLATLFTNLRLIDNVKGACNSFTLNHEVFASCGNVNLKAEPVSRQDQPIQKVYIHPEHSNFSLTNDYALLITKPFTYTNEVGRVCLPNNDIEENEAFDNAECITLGHGQDDFQVYSDKIKKAKPGLIERNDCEDKLNQGHFFDAGINKWKLHDTHLCAGNGETDTCKGDGGGPLLCKYNFLYEADDYTSYFQVGVTAWGPKSCLDSENNLPSVYSRVSRVTPWINKIVGCNVVTNCVNIADIADIRDTAGAQDFDLRTSDFPEIVGCNNKIAGALDFDLRGDFDSQDCSCSAIATADDVDIRNAESSDFDIRTVD